jgi:hypothetical protein
MENRPEEEEEKKKSLYSIHKTKKKRVVFLINMLVF